MIFIWVSINRDTPKWMVYTEKSCILKLIIWRYHPHFRKPPNISGVHVHVYSIKSSLNHPCIPKGIIEALAGIGSIAQTCRLDFFAQPSSSGSSHFVFFSQKFSARVPDTVTIQPQTPDPADPAATPLPSGENTIGITRGRS